MSFRFRKPLYGISQRRAVHFVYVEVKKPSKRVGIAFPHFAEHPPHGLVYQIVRVGEQSEGYPKSVIEFTVAYQHQGRHYRYPLFPQIFRF